MFVEVYLYWSLRGNKLCKNTIDLITALRGKKKRGTTFVHYICKQLL